jgi:hypothetical protein
MAALTAGTGLPIPENGMEQESQMLEEEAMGMPENPQDAGMMEQQLFSNGGMQ